MANRAFALIAFGGSPCKHSSYKKWWHGTIPLHDHARLGARS